MAALPNSDPIADAIYRGIERAAGDERRPHLGASMIGHPCSRRLWYSFRWAEQEQIDGRMRRLFETGRLQEARVMEDLRRAGIEVLDRAPSGEQWRSSDFGNWVAGHFGGSADAVVRGIPGAEKTYHVLEVKTHNRKSFDKLTKEGVRKAKPMHYDQAVMYMHIFGLERAAVIAVCKDDERIYTERLRADPDHAKGLLARAESIIKANEPPPRISERPDYFECSYCPMKQICHGRRAPHPTCRTCAHAAPRLDGEGGRWTCAAPHMAAAPELSVEVQKRTCGTAHRFIPILLAPAATATDYRESDGAVTYTTEGGEQFINGNGDGDTLTSVEIRHATGIAVLPLAAELKVQHPGARLVEVSA